MQNLPTSSSDTTFSSRTKKMLSFILGAVIVCLFVLYRYTYYSEDAIIFAKIPGPKRIPILGNILDLLLEPEFLFKEGRIWAKKFNGVYSMETLWIRHLNICNADDAEVILTSQKHIQKSILYDFLKPWLNEGLLTSKGDKWQKRRKILTPAFHFNILRQFCDTFSEQSENIVQSLKGEIGKLETDIAPFISQFTINSICETAMGTQLESSETSTFKKYENAIHEIGKIMTYRLVRIWLYVNSIFQFSFMGRKQNRLLSTLHKFTLDIIRKRRETMRVEITSTSISDNIENDAYMKSTKRRLAFLDLLLSAESKGEIDEHGIREEVDTFMFEGHDTTRMAITFCLMSLANNKPIQERIVAELDEIFENNKQTPTVEDFNKMKYLELCLKETLRLYPSVTFISRVLKEQVKMPNFIVPAGTSCHIHIFDMHRDPAVYPDPEKFIPERFTLENCSKRNPFAYIPFSAGPRNCIGQKFAMYELKSVVSSILRNYRLEPVTKPEDIVFYSDLVLRNRDPIKVKILPRNS